MVKVPKAIPRGTFTEGEDFKVMRRACIASFRKHKEKIVREMITAEVQKMRSRIHKVVVTDDYIQVYDQKGNILFKM